MIIQIFNELLNIIFILLISIKRASLHPYTKSLVGFSLLML